MSKSALDTNADAKAVNADRSLLPVKTIAWVLFLALAILVMRLLTSLLDDQFGIGLDVINVICYLLTVVIWVSLLVHFLFFNKSPMVARVACLLVLIGLPFFFNLCCALF